MKERWVELGTDKLLAQLKKDDFEFVPYLKKEEVLKLMSNATATIVLSRFEAFSMVVGEAASVGCPLIVSNKLGLNNLIHKFDASIIVNPYDKNEVADAMIKMEDKDYNVKYGVNSQRLYNFIISNELIIDTVAFYKC